MSASPRPVLVGLLAVVVAAFAAAPPAGAEASPADPRPAVGDTAWSDSAITAWATGAGISTLEAGRRAASQDRAVVLADQLAVQLADRGAGSWLAADGRLVVNVVSARDARIVRQAGAQARVVGTTLAELDRATAGLDGEQAPVGVSWGVDVTSNSLHVTVPAGVDATAFLAAAAAQGVPVTAVTTPSVPAVQAFYGGEAILLSGGGRCSAGFVTQSASGTPYLVTAGHCTKGVARFTDESGTAIGATAATSFPGDDFGAVRISNGSLDAQGGVATEGIVAGDGPGEGGIVDVTGAGRVPVGSQVCKAGSTTGYTCGTVQAYNVTVNYAEGRVGGLTRTTVCTQPGDSGGALIAGSLGQGVVSGGSSNVGCESSSFQSYFQPLDEVLRVYGLTVR